MEALPAPLPQFDITQCVKCSSLLTDPRVLPCFHGYCLRCLEELVKAKQIFNCRLCQQSFTLPKEGVEKLRKDLFIQKLVNVRSTEVTRDQEVLCETCSGERKPAAKHCVQCEQKFCDSCSAGHLKLKMAASHTLLNLDSLPGDHVVQTLPFDMCPEHERKQLEIYCKECRTTMCVECLYNHAHSKDNTEKVKSVSERLRDEMKMDLDSLEDNGVTCHWVLHHLNGNAEELAKRVEKTKAEVKDAADALRKKVTNDEFQLCKELDSLKERGTQEIAKEMVEVGLHLSRLDACRKYGVRLKEIGTACDVARSHDVLQKKAKELREYDLNARVKAASSFVDVAFNASSCGKDPAVNLLGSVQEKRYGKDLSIPMIMQKGAKVGGVTSLGESVFVVRENSNKVEVYDVKTLKLQSRIQIPGLGAHPWGMTSCARRTCLYVSDFDKALVHRIYVGNVEEEMDEGTRWAVVLAVTPTTTQSKDQQTRGSSGQNPKIKSWSVASSPTGLSVTKTDNNVMVVSSAEHKIQEYTTHGNPVREINLLPNMPLPRHAIELDTGQLVISHCDSMHRVCLVDVDTNAPLKWYGGLAGSREGQLHWPSGLAVSKGGYVLIADQHNSRILIVDRTLSLPRRLPLPLIVPVPGGMVRPYSLCLDENHDQLYVGDQETGRVLVYNDVMLLAAGAD